MIRSKQFLRLWNPASLLTHQQLLSSGLSDAHPFQLIGCKHVVIASVPLFRACGSLTSLGPVCSHMHLIQLTKHDTVKASATVSDCD